MTAKQMVRHLGCAYEVALGRACGCAREGDAAGAGEVGGAAVGSALAEERFDDAGAETGDGMGHSDATFDELVCEAIEKMERLATWNRFAPSHPMFGPMTAADWMRWGYLHADHHLRQFGR